MSDYTSPSDFEVLVESNEEVAADFYRLRLYHSAVAERVIPGQFVQLQVGSGGMAPLLRVPSVSAPRICGKERSRFCSKTWAPKPPC